MTEYSPKYGFPYLTDAEGDDAKAAEIVEKAQNAVAIAHYDISECLKDIVKLRIVNIEYVFDIEKGLRIFGLILLRELPALKEKVELNDARNAKASQPEGITHKQEPFDGPTKADG